VLPLHFWNSTTKWYYVNSMLITSRSPVSHAVASPVKRFVSATVFRFFFKLAEYQVQIQMYFSLSAIRPLNGIQSLLDFPGTVLRSHQAAQHAFSILTGRFFVPANITKISIIFPGANASHQRRGSAASDCMRLLDFIWKSLVYSILMRLSESLENNKMPVLSGLPGQ
jgi:hypothetical protein